MTEMLSPQDRMAIELTRLREENERLRGALDESVKLQSHYAALLNMHDGGKRIAFGNADAWLKRLKEVAR